MCGSGGMGGGGDLGSFMRTASHLCPSTGCRLWPQKERLALGKGRSGVGVMRALREGSDTDACHLGSSAVKLN